MAEYIDRDAALDIVNGWREQLLPTYGKNDEYVKCLEPVAEHLETLHAADVVERKTGKWRRYSPLTDTFECDQCGYQVIDKEFRTNYCPNCGAKMEVDNDV